MRVVGGEHKLPYARFSFQKTTFCFRSPDALASEYDALAYPTQGAVSSFLSGRGHARPDDVALADRIWGENVFDIPMPTFTQLFKVRCLLKDGRGFGKGLLPPRLASLSMTHCLVLCGCVCTWQEHAVAPFFVFQVVCVLLWSLDDLWYAHMPRGVVWHRSRA